MVNLDKDCDTDVQEMALETDDLDMEEVSDDAEDFDDDDEEDRVSQQWSWPGQYGSQRPYQRQTP